MDVTVPRRLWSSYRTLAGFGVLLGAVVGVMFVMAITGGRGGLLFVLGCGSAVGAATAAVGCLGGFLALRRAESREDRAESMVNAGAGGAGIAVCAMWMTLGVVLAIAEQTTMFLLLLLPVAIIAGVVTWVLAGSALHWRESRQTSRAVEPSSD